MLTTQSPCSPHVPRPAALALPSYTGLFICLLETTQRKIRIETVKNRIDQRHTGRSQWQSGVTEAQGLVGWKGVGDRGVHGEHVGVVGAGRGHPML